VGWSHEVGSAAGLWVRIARVVLPHLALLGQEIAPELQLEAEVPDPAGRDRSRLDLLGPIVAHGQADAACGPGVQALEDRAPRVWQTLNLRAASHVSVVGVEAACH